jgi:hypothetical protein
LSEKSEKRFIDIYPFFAKSKNEEKMQGFGVFQTVFHCFGAHFSVPLNTDHKREKSRKDLSWKDK